MGSLTITRGARIFSKRAARAFDIAPIRREAEEMPSDRERRELKEDGDEHHQERDLFEQKGEREEREREAERRRLTDGMCACIDIRKADHADRRDEEKEGAAEQKKKAEDRHEPRSFLAAGSS